ncbi:MAG: hypothetical protein DIU54_003750 [Acidobacteriota bacterium]|jgi:uncharacterized coiled-coil protein SlyX
MRHGSRERARTGSGRRHDAILFGVSTSASDPRALQLYDPDQDLPRLAALEAQLAERERALEAMKLELQELQDRYLAEIGSLYRELAVIEQQALEAEVRAGLRPPPHEADVDEVPEVDGQADAADAADAACGAPAPPSDLLKRVFRDVAKSLHPDLAMDDAARLRRHSLMAEANRAYAERDHDRLLLILRRWEAGQDAEPVDDPDAERERRRRRFARIEERLAEIETEFIELRNSGIARLKHKIDETRRQGWDLFAEMKLQVQSDIARARARLKAVEQMVGIRTPGRPDSI